MGYILYIILIIIIKAFIGHRYPHWSEVPYTVNSIVIKPVLLYTCKNKFKNICFQSLLEASNMWTSADRYQWGGDSKGMELLYWNPCHRMSWVYAPSNVDIWLTGKSQHNNGKDKAETGWYVTSMYYCDPWRI